MDTALAASTRHTDDQRLLGAPALASTRKRYVARACLNCQTRKTKCTGEQPCLQCRNTGEDCVYSTGRFRRRRRSKMPQQEVPEEQAQKSVSNESASEVTLYHATGPPLHGNEPRWKLDLSARIARLEQRLNGSERSHSDGASFFSSEEGFTDLDHASPKFQGGTDLLNPISILDRFVGPSDVQYSIICESNQQPEGGCCFNDCRSFPICCIGDLQMWNEGTKSQDIESLRASIQKFFDCLNPHYLCLHESYFISRFESYLVENQAASKTMDSHQFVALVNLVVAVVKILEEYCVDSKVVPGWKEFSRAQHLLSHTTSLGRGNLLTIQCLILKTIYFLFIERQNAAYDAISSAVRLTYQIGLHDQTSWLNSSSFDMTMRQRIFWCLYCLDRNVALVCGVPFLIREPDFKVDLPHSMDGIDVLISQPSLDPDSASIPYLHRTIKWAKLCSEIWDTMFGMNASNLTSQEFVATMDARIMLLVHDLPPDLQWTPTYLDSPDIRRYPLYILRQAIVIHLRTNHLRLLLRRKEMVNLKYHPREAEACVDITTSSIDAIHAVYTSTFHQRTDRYSSVIYLSGAIIPLTCIIIKDDNDIDNDLRVRAGRAFQKAVSLLQDIAPGHTFAKRVLSRLRRIVDAANRKILAKGLADETDEALRNDDRWVERSIGFDYQGAASDQLNGSHGDMMDDTLSGDVWDGGQFWPVFEMETFDAMF